MFSGIETILIKVPEWVRKNQQMMFAIGLSFVLANVFAYSFIRQERFIYFWDFMTYFKKYIYLNDHIIREPLQAISTVFWSIREDQYNYLPAFLLTPFSIIFGSSRVSYILAIVNIYALPAMVFYVLLAKKLSIDQQKPSAALPWIVMGLTLFSPDFWNPVLKGFVGVGGTAVTAFIYLIYLKNPFSEQKKRDLFLIAVLIPVLVVFRRWYAYWGVSFYFILFINICVDAFQSGSPGRKKFPVSVAKYSVMGLISAVVFFSLTPTYGREILGSNFGDLYSPFKYSANYFQSFIYALKSFGLLYFTLFLLGCINAMISKNTRKFVLFILCQSIIIFLMFAKLQDFASHQRYMFLPQVIIFSALFLNSLFFKINRIKLVTICVLITLLVCNFIIALGPQKKMEKKSYPTVFTNIRHQPFVRNDLDEIERMLITLEKLLKDPEDRVYVLSSTDILNSHLASSAWTHFKKYKNVCTRIFQTKNLDKRDGFPSSLLQAEYVVVPSPVQFRMAAQDQRVVIIPTELFHNNKGIAKSFEKLPYEFDLESDVKVHIYKKVRPIDDSDVHALSKALRSYYPDRPHIYEGKT